MYFCSGFIVVHDREDYLLHSPEEMPEDIAAKCLAIEKSYPGSKLSFEKKFFYGYIQIFTHLQLKKQFEQEVDKLYEYIVNNYHYDPFGILHCLDTSFVNDSFYTISIGVQMGTYRSEKKMDPFLSPLTLHDKKALGLDT